MKKYIPKAAKPLLFVTLINCALLAIGIVLTFIEIPDIGLSIGLLFIGGVLGILFLACYVAEASRTLVIDTDKMIFPRGAIINGKQVFCKTVVKICDIRSVESKLHKGDKIISNDCFFYTLKIKDGTSITVTLYAYGKDAEKEIWETIKSNIV